MLRRLALVAIALGVLVAAAAIAAINARGNASDAPTPSAWEAGKQSFSKKIASSPAASKLSADAQHLLGTSSPVVSNAHVPLSSADGTKIEVGRRVDGAVCFDVTIKNRSLGGACGRSVDPNRISGTIDVRKGEPTVYSGLAGDNVTAIDVITDQSTTIPAVIQNGAYYSIIPEGAGIKGWVVTITDGSKTTYDWPPN